MRKLTDIEVNACRFLAREGGYFLSEYEGPATAELRSIFHGLVKKRRVHAEQEDSGVRYTLTAQGEADAA